MSCDSTGLCVVYLYRSFWSELVSFNIEEVDIVGAHVDDGEGQHCISDLPVEPLRLVQREPSDVRSYEPHQISAHWQ